MGLTIRRRSICRRNVTAGGLAAALGTAEVGPGDLRLASRKTQCTCFAYHCT